MNRAPWKLGVALCVAVCAGCAQGVQASGPEPAFVGEFPASLRVSGEPSWISLGFSPDEEPKSLSELPDSIQRTVNALMVARLGESLYARLTFIGGQVVDTTDLYRRIPEARGIQWPLFGHRLGFRLTEPEKGVDSYYGYITLDLAGAPMGQIEFPDARADLSKATIISVDSARAVTIAAGLRPSSVQMMYREDAGSLVYQFSQITVLRPNYRGGKRRFIVVDAHSGRILADFISEFAA